MEWWIQTTDEQGTKNNATVSYTSTSKNLSVAFTKFDRNQVQQVIRNIHLSVDLLRYLPDRVIVGFSAATGARYALYKIISWSFNSTVLEDENKVNTGLIVGLVVGGGFILVVGVLGLLWFIFCIKRDGESSSDDDSMALNDMMMPEEFEKGTGPRKFSYNELSLATSNFAEGEKLGEGGFGGVYKGFIKDMNSYVAVKKISSGSKQGLSR